jgi:hypothetical protein
MKHYIRGSPFRLSVQVRRCISRIASRQIFQNSKLQPVNSLVPTLRVLQHAINEAPRVKTQIIYVSKTHSIEGKRRRNDWLRSIGMPVIISPLLRQRRVRRLLSEKEAASAALDEGFPLATYVHFHVFSSSLSSSCFYSFILYSSELFFVSQSLYLGTGWLRVACHVTRFCLK